MKRAKFTHQFLSANKTNLTHTVSSNDHAREKTALIDFGRSSTMWSREMFSKIGAIECSESIVFVKHTIDASCSCRQVLAHVRTIPELILLGSGSQNVKRLPIFSFMVRHPRGTFLHHNFVCAVLNDVFGIQARGGCACAGRYAHDLMGIDQELAREYQRALTEGYGSGEKFRFDRVDSGRDAARRNRTVEP